MTKVSAYNNKKARQSGGRSAPCVHADTETVVKVSGPEDLRDELLPRIPNDIAWQVIAPKLSGTDINTLSLVSSSWNQTIHGRWVYDVKVRSHSTDKFGVVLFSLGQANRLRLYPLNGKSAYDLPSIVSSEFRNIAGSKCIALDGKLYILGGAILGGPTTESCPGSKAMFMLDVAGHKLWKQCSSMQEGRHSFGAGVLDGKIYVVGGRNNDQFVYKCEVYDPKVDGWTSIADLVRSRMDDRVGAIGGELFVYGGREWIENLRRRPFSRDVAVYNPVQNEWRLIGHFIGPWFRSPWINSFLAQGKLHTVLPNGVNVYDIDTNSWSHLHPIPRKMGFNGSFPWVLDDELVTEKYRVFYSRLDRFSEQFPRVRLVQSRGLGSKDMQIGAIGNSRLRHDLEHCPSPTWKYDFCPIDL